MNARQEQAITSAKTARNQIPALFRKKITTSLLAKNAEVLDFGCGKGKAQEVTDSLDCEYFGFDPYNMSEPELKRTRERMSLWGFDLITCANVLNVLTDDVIDNVCRELAYHCTNAGTVLVSVYEGNKTGTGQETRDGYQRNERTANYAAYLSKYFDLVSYRDGVLICSNVNYDNI